MSLPGDRTSSSQDAVRLSGVDAAFLAAESDSQTSSFPLLIELAAVGADAAPLTLDALQRHVASRLDDVPSLRWRIRTVPGGLFHPVMVDDPDFDIGYHVRRVVLPPPGDETALRQFVARQSARHLDRRHPLWQLTLVDGLADRQVLVLVLHHTIGDGTAVRTTLSRLFTDRATPIGSPDPPADRSWPMTGHNPVGAPVTAPGKVPNTGAVAMVLAAVVGLLRAWHRAPGVAADAWRNGLALRRRRRAASVTVPGPPRQPPATVLTRSFSMDRVMARVPIPVGDLRRVRVAMGVRLNDVLLAVVAGALRGYLADRGQLPDRPLVASVPVSGDLPDGPARQCGNRFGNCLTTLATDVDDPVRRLQIIAEVTAESRAQLQCRGPEIAPRLLELVPPVLAQRVGRAVAAAKRAHPERPDHDVLVSNVRGADDMVFLGYRVSHVYVGGPPLDAAGLNVTAYTTGEEMAVCVLANPAALDCPEELVDRMRHELEQLVAVSGDRSAPGAAPGRARRMRGGTAADTGTSPEQQNGRFDVADVR